MKAGVDPYPAELARLARAAKALAHPARVAILRHLAAQDDCVCGELVTELPLAQATVSQHLKVLREAGLIRVSTDGARSRYCIDREAIAVLEREMGGLLAGLRAGCASSRC